MITIIFETDNAKFQFDQKDVKACLEILIDEYGVDEADTILKCISSQTGETKQIQVKHDYFDHIVLELIGARKGYVTCEICGKLYKAAQLKSHTVGHRQRPFDDNLINVNDISFDNLDSVSIAGEPHPLRMIAQRSFTWRLGIPFQYLRKCPPEIQSINLNYWIEHEKNDQLFFRFDDRDIRAIFTPKYKPVDNFEICERLDSLGYGPDTSVQCTLDPEFMSLSILDGKKSFDINGDRFRPGISISNSEVGLASLSISAFILRLICTNGLVSKTEISASYRHVSTKILDEFPVTMDKVSYELGAQKQKIGLSMESSVDDPLKTIETFNRQFSLNQPQKEAVEWAWPLEIGNNMFAVVNTYTRASQYKDLSAENSYQLQRVGGNILGMLN